MNLLEVAGQWREANVGICDVLDKLSEGALLLEHARRMLQLLVRDELGGRVPALRLGS
jgi:hypothetical protein